MNLGSELVAILQAGAQAPSGENCQPWEFVVKSPTEIEINLVPDRDRSLYNSGQRASYFALGAALENIILAAEYFGYAPQVTYFPDAGASQCVAKVKIPKSEAGTKAEGLYPYISKRSTNRKPYDSQPLQAAEIDKLFGCAENNDYPRLVFVQERASIQTLAEVGSANEYIMLSNRHLHDFFFNHVNWTKEEDDRKKIGFYIKTLELPPPAQFMFKILKKWSVAKYFAKVNFHSVVAKQNAAGYSQAAAIGAILIKENEPINFVLAGRLMERLWLTATTLNLHIQPMTGILFFKIKLLSGEPHQFSPKQVDLIDQSYEKVRKAFGVSDELIPMMFRIGKAEHPTAQSARFDWQNVTKIMNSL